MGNAVIYRSISARNSDIGSPFNGTHVDNNVPLTLQIRADQVVERRYCLLRCMSQQMALRDKSQSLYGRY